MSQAQTIREFRHELADQFRRQLKLPLPLRSGLVFACLADRPPRSEKALAAKVKASRTTLWRNWTTAVIPAAQRQLPTLLRFLRLLADLQAHFENPSRTKPDKDLRDRSVKHFGVFPLDEREAVELAIS